MKPETCCWMLAIAVCFASPAFAEEPTLEEKDATEGAPASKSTWGGFLDAASNFGQGLRRQVAGNPVEYSEAELATLRRAEPVVREMAGPDGVLDRGDLRDIRTSMQPSIGSEVSREIWRQANQRVYSSRFPRLARPLVNGHVRNNWGRYYQQGMRQGNALLARGMDDLYNGFGIQGAGTPGDPTPRNLNAQGMQYFSDAGTILQRKDRERGGAMHATFPNGLSVDAYRSIYTNPNELPPGAVLAPRERAVTAPVAQPARQYASGGYSQPQRRGGLLRRRR